MMHPLEAQEQSNQTTEKPPVFKGDEVEVIEQGLQMIQSVEMSDNDRQAFESGIESLLQEPDHPSLLGIDDPIKKLQLQSEYTILHSVREHCLAALLVVENVHKNGRVPPQLIGRVAEFLAKYQRQLTKYRNASESNNTAVQATEIASKHEDLYDFLEITQIHKKDWESIVQTLQEPVQEPSATEQERYSQSYKAFIELRQNDAHESKNALTTMLYGYLRMMNTGKTIEVSTEEQKMILESIHVYLKKKDQYEADLHNYKQSSLLNTVAATVGSEIGEEVFESFGERFDALKIKDIKLLSAANAARAEMLANGVQNPPSVGEIFKRLGSNGVNVLRQSARVVSPNNAASLIVFMLYIQGAEDKTRALLSYSSFMAASKGLDKVSAMLSKTPGLQSIATRLGKTKLPMALKFAVIITAAMYGGQHLESAISALERRADPTLWDGAGNVMGLLSAPADIYGQYAGKKIDRGTAMFMNPALGTYMLLSGKEDIMIDPYIDTRKDQLEYLTLEAGMVQNTGLTGAHAKERITMWDQVVEAYASSETNPTLQKLMRLESIQNGPGGHEGWVSRQALQFYQMYTNVETLENEINTQVQSLGITTPMLSLAHLLHNETSTTGDRNVRYEMVYNQEIYTAFLNNVEARKTELQTKISSEHSPEKKAEIQEMITQIDALKEQYTYYEHFVKKADKLRSDYIRLGIFSNDWIKKPVDQKVPEIVMRGMYSTIDIEEQRRTVLSQYKNAEEISELVRKNGPPAFTLDPMGWVGYFIATNATWDDRIFEERYVNASREFVEQIGNRIGANDRDNVFRNLFDQLSKQPNKPANGREVMSQISAAYADHYFEGEIRDATKLLEGKTDKYNNPRSFERIFYLAQDRTNETGYITTHDVIDGLENTREPVIICSQMVGTAEITSTIRFIHDHTKNTWNVITQTTSYVPFYESSVMYAEPIYVQQSANATIEENFATWRIRHPKLAMQIAPQMIGYLEQITKENAEYKQRQAADLARRQEEKPENLRRVETENGLRSTALENAFTQEYPQYIPPKWEYDAVNTRIIQPSTQSSYEFAFGTLDSQVSFFVPPMNAGPSMSAMHSDWRKEVFDNEKLQFCALRDGKKYNYAVSMWELKTGNTLDAKNKSIARSILTTPIDIQNHPDASNPKFVEYIRAYEIERMLNMTQFDWSGSWKGTDVEAYFYKELIKKYAKTPNGSAVFLDKLYNFLQSSEAITYYQCRNFLQNL